MHDFDYFAPTQLSKAVALLAEYGERAKPFAGGTDLIDQVRLRKLLPDVIVDLKKIEELNTFEITSEELRLGAAVSCDRISRRAEVRCRFSALDDSCRLIGSIQIQNRASVGGNVCNSSPAGDTNPALICLGATCHLVGPAGTRTVPIVSFFTGPGKNVLSPQELLFEFRIPTPPDHSGSAYQRFIPRNEMDIAVVGVGASVRLDESGARFVSGRIALGAVAPTPLAVEDATELMMDSPVNDDTISKIVEVTKETATPIDDLRGTKEFRKQITAVLAKRVLRQAIERAKSNETKSNR